MSRKSITYQTEGIFDKLTPIAQTWKKSVSINVAEELEKNSAELVYQIMIAYQQPKRCGYYDGVKKSIDYIEEQFNSPKYIVNTTFPIKVFFMFFQLCRCYNDV